MKQLVLLRHGQSTWNAENRFTGWADVPLSPAGVEEARAAGRLLAAHALEFDIAFTSLLQRAIKTLYVALDECGQLWIPVERSWRLNERMYGALTGLNKAETAARYGDAQVHLWRRSYDIPPPALDPRDPYWPGHDRRYAGLQPREIPRTESLKDTFERLLPYWQNEIARGLANGKRVLIAAHGNSLRALIKHLDGIGDAEIAELNLPTGAPLLYELDDQLRPVSRRYLGAPATP